MSWTDVYLVCFIVGFLLSLLSFVAGSAHLHLPHFPHLHGHHGPLIPHGPHGAHGARGSSQVSPFNIGTFAAFLAWFGGAGYLLERYSGLWFLLALAIAVVSGVTGAALIFWFLAKVLMPREQDLDPADYELIGVLGRISSAIREGGTGEMMFSQAGARKCAGARSEDGTPIPKGTEVVITHHEKGIAYVRRWDELNKSVDLQRTEASEERP